MNVKRSVVSIAITAGIAGLLVSSHPALADQGNWSTGCAAGWTCMWEGTVGPSASVDGS